MLHEAQTKVVRRQKEDAMVNYGENFDDEAPTSMHVRRAERRYNMHKLARAVGNLRYQRTHGGESTKHK
ncbi:MAG TPA: hypothetical protein VF572_04205 [Candidatus Saccharimonadales bacterium]